MSEIDPIWLSVLVGVIAFVFGRLSARAGRARQDDVSRPPPYTHLSSSSLPGVSGASVAAVSLTSEVEREVRALLARGQKIESIKVVRNATGLGLKEAKDLVESM